MMKLWPVLFLTVSLPANADYLDQLKQQNDLTAQVYWHIYANKSPILQQLQSDDQQQNAQAVIQITAAWQLADASRGIDSGDMLLYAMQYQPRMLLEWFERNPDAWQRWLSSQSFLLNGLLEASDFAELKKRITFLVQQNTDIASLTNQQRQMCHLWQGTIIEALSEIESWINP